MKILEVTVEGYQSHVQSTFSLSPNLTVITGPSDAGKTAIIRALRWMAFNEPTGEAFLHTIRNPDGSVKEAATQVKVSVTFDNGVTITKTRRKGKTTYTHSLYPESWEKAEIPPEIKEALGLVKQSYGDFETCLNFAFQLDAPFLLSETASTGAKVLGKLAGTEVVDKSISEVNKKTHQTRTEVSYQDKQIGEIDVSLTEYFELDNQEAQLKQAEEAFTKLQEAKKKHDDLVALMSAYGTNTERRIALFDKVEGLAYVVVASATLSQVEHDEEKREKLEALQDNFWKAVASQNEPLRVIRETRSVEDLQEQLTAVEDDEKRLLLLQSAAKRLEEGNATIYKVSRTIVDLDQAIGLKFLLEEAEEQEQQRTALSEVNKRLWEAMVEEQALREKVAKMTDTEAARGILDTLEADYLKLDNLKSVKDKYTYSQLTLHTKEVFLGCRVADVKEAEKEVHDAWEEAGGVCPLCGSEVENESI